MTRRRTRTAAEQREYDRTRRKDTPWRIARRTGYRTDPARHVAARKKVPKTRRVAIAKAAAAARTKKKREKKP